MPAISRKALAAVEAVTYIACKPGTAAVRSKEIAAYQKVPERYLEPVFQQLVHDKLLRSIRGPKGGYVLAKERRKLTVQEIICSVEKLEQHARQDGSPLLTKVVIPAWKDAHLSCENKLDSLTIQDLCERVQKTGVLKHAVKSDFTI